MITKLLQALEPLGMPASEPLEKFVEAPEC